MLRQSRSTRSLWVAAVAAAIALGLAACGEGGATTIDEAAGEVAAGAETLPTVNGGQIDVASLEGTDTILWFWAPW